MHSHSEPLLREKKGNKTDHEGRKPDLKNMALKIKFPEVKEARWTVLANSISTYVKYQDTNKPRQPGSHQ